MNPNDRHWSEYAIEAFLLGTFMVSACGFTILLEYPGSRAYQTIADPLVRRMLIGIAMGLTAISLVYSPLGRRSGAHMNPSITLTFLRLGKIRSRDAVAYIASQFLGGVAGVMLIRWTAGMLAADSSVRFALTRPAMGAIGEALAAEFAISLLLMTIVLIASNTRSLAPFTGILCGVLVATYITFEAPISGMSMNPARSFASALAAWDWQWLWIYFVAPPLGMLAASEIYVRRRGLGRVYCAKLSHPATGPCIFSCNFGALYHGEK